MNETEERRPPLDIPIGDLRVGDIWNSNGVYRDDDDSKGAVCEGVRCESVGGDRKLFHASWRVIATGEVVTTTHTPMARIPLMRRAASVSAREALWNELDLDLRPISRERFEACMDAYDRAASVPPVRPGEETTG